MNDQTQPAAQRNDYMFSDENYDPKDIAERWHAYMAAREDVAVLPFESFCSLTQAALVITIHRFLVYLYVHGRDDARADAMWFWGCYSDLAEDLPWDELTAEAQANHIRVTGMFVSWFDGHAEHVKIPRAPEAP
jgi:hypothetical protein